MQGTLTFHYLLEVVLSSIGVIVTVVDPPSVVCALPSKKRFGCTLGEFGPTQPKRFTAATSITSASRQFGTLRTVMVEDSVSVMLRDGT